MKKSFCDICEQPASDRHQGIAVHQEIGPMYETCRDAGAGFRKTRNKVTATVSFGFRDHPTGFGGPPDLCDKCAVELIQKALDLALIKTTRPDTVPAPAEEPTR